MDIMPYVNNTAYISNELIFAIVASVTAIIFIVLYIREYYIRQQTLKNPELVLQKSREESFDIIHDAIKKSQEILSEAEIDEIKLEREYINQISKATTTAQSAIIDVKTDFVKFLDQLRDDINQSKPVKQSEQALTRTASEVQESLTKTQAGFEQFLEDLKSTINQAQFTSQELIKQQVNKQFEKFEQNLSDFLTQTEQQSMKAVELEIKSARQLIDTYKSQQLALIDENIISMLERTLNLVLSKKLSLKDQMDLVYESLEKAKVEKVIT